MGKEMAPLVEAQFDSVLIDPEARAYLASLVAEMGTHSVRKDELAFTFEILDSSIPNAFALPGGYVYITRGLLVNLESEGQFISVLGHELGHVEHQHSMIAQSRKSIAGFPGRTIAGIGSNIPIVGGVTSVAGGLVSLGPALVVLSYDRGQEIEADDRGIYFSDAMGYDPRDGIKTFELFKRMEEQAGGGGQLSFLSTHPQNDDRITNMEEVIAEEYPKVATAQPASFRTGGANFQDIVGGLRANAAAYAARDEAYQILAKEGDGAGAVGRAEKKLLEAHEAIPDEPLFLLGLGELAMVREDYEAAVGYLSRSAQIYEDYSPNKGHWKPFFYMGLLSLGAEEPELAVAFLKGAEARCEPVPEVHFLSGAAEEALGNTAEAKKHYERVLELAPKGAEVSKEARARLKAL